MGTSIPCQESTRDRLKDLRDGYFRSWDEFLHALADAYEGETAKTVPENGGGARLTVDGEFVGVVESMEASVETVEERTGRIERQLEDLQR